MLGRAGARPYRIPSRVRALSHKRTLMPASSEDHCPLSANSMTTTKQRAAARKNIQRAASAAKRKRTVSHLPKKVRTALGKEGAKAARKKRASQAAKS